MEKIGQRIKTLRLSKGLTQQDLCGDESHLTIRQLIRIEKGESKPSLERLAYLAQQLGIHTYELMGDYQELPQRYLSLKNWILRHDDYGSALIQEQKEDYFDQIFEDYYEQLPADEQFAIDCLAANNQIKLTHDLHYGLSVFEERIDQFAQKTSYGLNDFIFIQMLSRVVETSLETGVHFDKEKLVSMPLICDRLLQQGDVVDLSNFFIFRDALIALLRYFNRVGDYTYYPAGIRLLQDIMEKTQDYQKKPVLLMLMWKEALFVGRDFEIASQNYHDAIELARLLLVPGLKPLLEAQWQKDLKVFYNL